MENFTQSDLEEAKDFTEFFTDLMDNNKESVVYYLSEDATLDWFGQTVKGEKKISIFLKNHVTSVKHLFNNPKPVTKIGHRDTHVVKYPRENKKRHISFPNLPVVTSEEKTPPNILASSSHLVEQGQGDGIHNCDLPVSPAKRSRLGDVVTEDVCAPVKYVSADGHVEFHKRSSKKFQRETKWARPCKLEIAYSSTNIKDSTIYLIIYSNNMKCRRNLLKEFDSVDKSE